MHMDVQSTTGMQADTRMFQPAGNVKSTAQVGIPVLVLERGASLRLEGSAIAMWGNAFRALDALGVAAPLRDAHPLLERQAGILAVTKVDGPL